MAHINNILLSVSYWEVYLPDLPKELSQQEPKASAFSILGSIFLSAVASSVPQTSPQKPRLQRRCLPSYCGTDPSLLPSSEGSNTGGNSFILRFIPVACSSLQEEDWFLSLRTWTHTHWVLLTSAEVTASKCGQQCRLSLLLLVHLWTCVATCPVSPGNNWARPRVVSVGQFRSKPANGWEYQVELLCGTRGLHFRWALSWKLCFPTQVINILCLGITCFCLTPDVWSVLLPL